MVLPKRFIGSKIFFDCFEENTPAPSSSFFFLDIKRSSSSVTGEPAKIAHMKQVKISILFRISFSNAQACKRTNFILPTSRRECSSTNHFVEPATTMSIKYICASIQKIHLC